MQPRQDSTNQVELTFVDELPSSRYRSPQVRDIIAQLQARAGQWAVIAREPHARRAGTVRRMWADRGCEAVTRKSGDEVLVYIRWPKESTR